MNWGSVHERDGVGGVEMTGNGGPAYGAPGHKATPNVGALSPGQPEIDRTGSLGVGATCSD